VSATDGTDALRAARAMRRPMLGDAYESRPPLRHGVISRSLKTRYLFSEATFAVWNRLRALPILSTHHRRTIR
jgi:hypothetical protein